MISSVISIKPIKIWISISFERNGEDFIVNNGSKTSLEVGDNWQLWNRYEVIFRDVWDGSESPSIKYFKLIHYKIIKFASQGLLFCARCSETQCEVPLTWLCIGWEHQHRTLISLLRPDKNSFTIHPIVPRTMARHIVMYLVKLQY